MTTPSSLASSGRGPVNEVNRGEGVPSDPNTEAALKLAKTIADDQAFLTDIPAMLQGAEIAFDKSIAVLQAPIADELAQLEARILELTAPLEPERAKIQAQLDEARRYLSEEKRLTQERIKANRDELAILMVPLVTKDSKIIKQPNGVTAKLVETLSITAADPAAAVETLFVTAPKATLAEHLLPSETGIALITHYVRGPKLANSVEEAQKAIEHYPGFALEVTRRADVSVAKEAK